MMNDLILTGPAWFAAVGFFLPCLPCAVSR